MSIQTRLLTSTYYIALWSWKQFKMLSCPRHLFSSHARLLISVYPHSSFSSLRHRTLFCFFQICSLLFLFSPLAQNFIPLFLPTRFTFSLFFFSFPLSYANLPSLVATKSAKKQLLNKFYKRPPQPKLECDDIQMNSKPYCQTISQQS